MFDSVKHAFLLQGSLEALIYAGNLQVRSLVCSVRHTYFVHANISLDGIHGHLHCTRCLINVVQVVLKIWLIPE